MNKNDKVNNEEKKHRFIRFEYHFSSDHFIAMLIKMRGIIVNFWKMKRVGNSPFRLNSMIIFNLWTRAIKYGKKNNDRRIKRKKENEKKMNGTFSAFLLFATCKLHTENVRRESKTK